MNLPLLQWRISDSNRRPFDCEPNALPTELIPHCFHAAKVTLFSIVTKRRSNIFYRFNCAKLSRNVFSLLSASACFLRSFSTTSGLALATNFSFPSFFITDAKKPSK